MSNYISSKSNRFYVGVEPLYAQAAPITSASRFPALHLHAQQVLEQHGRIHKTGTRTFLGGSREARRRTAFQISTYLTSWSGAGEPCYGPLLQATMGAAPQLSLGLSVLAVVSPIEFQTINPHGLSVGSAVSYSGEIRFVQSVVNSSTFTTNAPFSRVPSVNECFCPTFTYSLANILPSVTLYDYWEINSMVSRIITGAGVDNLQISINGDYHNLTFSGSAADIISPNSFQAGTAGLQSYPSEPAARSFDYAGVPGHLGQVWLGQGPSQMFTLTEASVQIKNNLELRRYEFGSTYPKSIVPGEREVASNFSLLVQEDSQIAALYSAAKQRTLISAMLQLGQQQGQLMGVYMPRVVPEMPNYVDSDMRLIWSFNNNTAQGISNDEIYIAFA